MFNAYLVHSLVHQLALAVTSTPCLDASLEEVVSAQITSGNVDIVLVLSTTFLPDAQDLFQFALQIAVSAHAIFIRLALLVNT
jgi:hypothetical protein